MIKELCYYLPMITKNISISKELMIRFKIQNNCNVCLSILVLGLNQHVNKVSSIIKVSNVDDERYLTGRVSFYT